MSDEVSEATVNENQKLAAQEEQITKPAPKVKPQKEKDPKKVVGLTAGVGYLAKKILKENFLGDPSSNVMNYAKFTGVLAGSMALKTYLEDQKILPKSI